MKTENLSTLKIHKLTQEQYNRELEAGNLEENALYLTPGEEIDLSNVVRTDNAGNINIPNQIFLSNQYGKVFSNINQTQILSYCNPNDSNNNRLLALRNNNYVPNIAEAIRLIDIMNGNQKGYTIFGQHNKPNGSYTGNGATSRTILLGDGAMGNAVYIWASDLGSQGFALRNEGFAWTNASTISLVNSNVSIIDGGLYFVGNTLNKSGKTYYYQVL